MKRIILKLLLALFVAFVLGVPAFIMWMRAGEEAPLDYSALDFELGPQDPEINGYTYLRQFCEEHEADIPENYPVNYMDDYEDWVDYNLYENWDLEFFEEILEKNNAFMAGMEAAFDLPVFMVDQDLNPDSFLFHFGHMRSYMQLRLLEARVLYLSGQQSEVLHELADLVEELNINMKSGGALIGLLTSVAMNGNLLAELWEFQGCLDLPAEDWRDFAKTYSTAELFPVTVRQVVRQEFQFLQNATKQIAKEGIIHYDLGFLSQTSEMEILISRGSQYIGWRENRTVNDIFLVYSEILEQYNLPVDQRRFIHAKQIETKPNQKSWHIYLNRNPYGQALLSQLLTGVTRALEIVDRSEASASATRISFALQAYAQEKGDLPDSLNALVPDYLAAIPRDPFDGEPMRYSKGKKIVYSVGNDFADQSGSERAFLFQLDPDDDYEAAELDNTEPTFALRFVM